MFDGYRQFCRQPADLLLVEAFLRDRLTNDDSVIVLASESASGTGFGFVQLYPSFSSFCVSTFTLPIDGRPSLVDNLSVLIKKLGKNACE